MLPVLLPLLSSLAPALVKVATGSERAEQVTRAVSSAVERATGVVPDTPSKAARAQALIEADPALFAQLRAQLQAIEQAELAALLADREDARGRDLRLHELGEGNERANIMLAMAFIAIIAIAAGLVMLNAWGERSEFTGAIFGFLTGIGGMFARNIGSAFDFEFGSSRGSKTKDAQIDGLARQLREAQAAAGMGAAGGVASGIATGMAEAAPAALEAVRHALDDDQDAADALNRRALSGFRSRMAAPG